MFVQDVDSVLVDICVFLIIQYKLLICLPPFFSFGVFSVFFPSASRFVEFVVYVAGWVGAHALSWGRQVMRLAAQS